MNDLGLVRQFGQHLLLEPAQDEGLITARSSAMCWGSFTALPKRRLNSPRLPSRPGLMKVNRLHSSQVVLDGRAGEGEPKIAVQLEQQLGPLGTGIFDLLRLIQHHGGPATGFERLRQTAEHAVVEQDDLARLGFADHPFPLGRVVEHHHLQLGSEACDLLLPVGDH